MRRFQLRLPRRQLHMHSRKNQCRAQLCNVLHRHGLRYLQAEKRRIISFQKIHRKVYFLFLSNFFSLREKVAKRGKNPCRIYRLCQCRSEAERVRLSPRVMFAHTSRTFGGTARRTTASPIFYGLQNRFTAPWFRVNFVRYEQNFNSGRSMMFCFSAELTKR